MSTMTKKFVQAQQEMYSIQGSVFEVKAEVLAQGMVEIPLGFQPLSVSACDDMIAISMYFEPGVCLAKVMPDGSGGLRFESELIHEVRHGTDTIRLFPGVYQPGGANRCFSATFNPIEGPDYLYLNRSDRTIYCICRSERYPGKWELYHKIELDETYYLRPAVHSILPTIDNTFLVVEGTRTTTDLRCNCYNSDGQLLQSDPLILSAKDMAYIGYDHLARKALYITSAMSKTAHGDFRGVSRNDEPCSVPQPILKGVNGTGVARMKDGLGVVARYGKHYAGPFGNGLPGSIIIVPHHLWK